MTDRVRPARVWRTVPEAKRFMAAEAFWRDEEARVEQAEAVGLLVKQYKFRPQTVRSLAVDRRARYLGSLLNPPETVAARLLVSYHLAHERPLLCAFLDALGIPHDRGLISTEVGPPDAASLHRAVAVLTASFPDDTIRLYFSTLLGQDPEIWAGLAPWVTEPPPSSRIGSGDAQRAT